MSRCAKVIIGLALAGGLGGALVAWSGIINVGASSGHWKVTEWVLHWAMRQSVETHSPDGAVPALDDTALARRGAGHYATACAPCHGAPGLQRSPVTSGMTPEPPFLPRSVGAWAPQELFWIVRHGVKYTGMPAWPSLQRRDEIWAMVAFLRRLPELDKAAYDALAHGSAGASQSIAAPGEQEEDAQVGMETTAAAAGCTRCHGSDGRGSAAFPRLAGQSADYLFASLLAFAEGRRHSGFMRAAAAGLDEAAMRRIAEHYGAVTPEEDARASTLEGNKTGGDAAAGGVIARRGDPARGVPACVACHGLEQGPRFPHYPRLAGQQAWYLALQLRLLKAGERGGTPFAPIMHAVAERLSDAQIDDLAVFYAGLPAR